MLASHGHLTLLHGSEELSTRVNTDIKVSASDTGCGHRSFDVKPTLGWG